MKIKRLTTTIMALFILIIISTISTVCVLATDPLEIYCASQGSKDGCLLGIAKDRKDPSYCAMIDNLGTRNVCYSYMAVEFNDESYCTKVKKDDGTYEDVYDCFEDFLEDPEDIAICNEYIKTGEFHDDCIKDIMKMTEDPEMCLLMDMMDSRLDCYLEFAEDQADENLCDLMLENIDVGECRHDDIDECDSDAKLEDHVRLCRNKVKAAALVHSCKSYDRNIETTFKATEKSEFIFKGDDAFRGTFTVDVKSIDLFSGYANTELKTGQVRRRYNLFLGQTVSFETMKVMVLDIYDKNEGKEDEDGDALDPEPIVKFCFFKEDFVPVIEPEVEEVVEGINETEEENETEPEAIIANESDYEIVEIEEEVVEEKKGVLRRMLDWFWGLFGVGD